MREPLSAWLEARQPAAVMALERWISGRDHGAPGAGPLARADALTALGASALAEARERPGRVRDSAFALLAADALLTYACEAALECEDVEGTLLRVLDGASAR